MSPFPSVSSSSAPINVLLMTALAPLSWGTTYIVTTELLPTDRPLLAGFARALPAGMAISAFTRVRPRGVWWYRTAVLGALYIGIFFPLLFIAAGRLPGGVAAIFGAIGPLITLGLAAMLLHETPTRRKALCGVAGVVGVALVVTSGAGHVDVVGAIAGTAGAVSMATATVLTKRWGRPSGVGALTFNGWQLTAGGMFIAPLLLAFEGLPASVDASNVVGGLYLAAGNTALAYWLWFRGIDRLPANSVAFLGLLSPVAAVSIGWLALGQSLSTTQFTGLAIALSAAVAGATHGDHLRKRSPTVVCQPIRWERSAV